jgi:hypothetical protein
VRCRVLGAIAALIVGACGSRSNHEILVYPDGTVGARAVCVDDETECHRQAQEACPHGYWVMSREQEPHMHVHATPYGAHHFRYLAIALSIRCAPRPS